MIFQSKTVKVAVIQAAPVLFDLDASVEKAERLIDEAANNRAELVVFPESFLPCYPRGLSFGFTVGSRTEAGRMDWLRYYENSIAIPGKQSDRLAAAAKKAGVYLSIGVTEKDGDKNNGTLYCSNLFYSPDGEFLGKHRKLKPTGSERYIWGEDDGSTITVIDTPFGKIGSLICWENYMPLARTALYMKGVDIFLVPTADSRDIYQHTMRHIAFEGRCFVLCCNQYVEKSMYPKDLHCYDELADAPEIMCRGGSSIVDPFGEYEVEPVYNREDILYAELDLSKIIKGKLDFDCVGHYSRPDIFDLKVNEK